jgi:L,D-transpeptidase catalytic domain/Putative peptidoglycan binding domain
MRPPMRRLSALPPLLVLIAAAPAGAQDAAPTTGTPPSATTPAPPATATPPPPAPAPAPATLTMRLERVNGRAAAVLAGDRFRVRGSVQPYVAGQRVVVRFYRGGRRVGARRVAVRPTSTGSRGTFVVGYASRRPGRLTVRAGHRATAQLATLVARPRVVDVLPLRARPGSTGAGVRALQRRLRALGYVVGKPGVLDARTARAVMAFRKVAGLPRTFEASTPVFRALARGRGGFRVRYPRHGKHVEADLSLQVLALIRGARVERIYPTSSGSPATPTVLGTFRVYSRTPGTNAKGMVFTSYFHGGYGIHGYADVPPFAASHGCLRVPVPDAVPIYSWLSFGDIVDVYR